MNIHVKPKLPSEREPEKVAISDAFPPEAACPTSNSWL